jgi:hypothetical protein
VEGGRDEQVRGGLIVRCAHTQVLPDLDQ